MASIDASHRPRPLLVLVLGMHRSGTSAVAGLLDRLGVRAGDRLLPPRGDNPLGFFEDEEIVAIHDRLLAAFGLDWASTDALPRDWLASAPAKEAMQALGQVLDRLFSAGDAVLVKDPRASRLVPLWRALIAERGLDGRVVLVVRHPDEVAGSLAARGGSTRAAAHALWLRYMLSAEADSREFARVVVPYGALLNDPAAEVARVLALLPGGSAIAPPSDEALSGWLRPSMRHHVALDDGTEPGIAVQVHHVLASLASAGGDSPAARARLDALARDAEPTIEAFAAALDARVDALVQQRLAALAAYVGLESRKLSLAHEATRVRALWSAAVPPAAPAPRLYVASGVEAFGESNAYDARIETDGERVCARFGPLRVAAGARLRFDPDASPGAFCVDALRVGGAAVAPLAARLAACSGDVLPTSGSDGVTFACAHDDPWVEFRLDAVTAHGDDAEVDIEVLFRRESVHGLLRAAQLAALAPIGTRIESLAATVADAADRIDASAGDLLALQRALADQRAADDARALAAEARMAAMQASIEALSVQARASADANRTMLAWMQRRSPGYWLRRLARSLRGSTGGGA